MTEKRQTRAELEAQISELQADLANHREVNAEQRRNLLAAANSEKETAALVNDLKERLATAESENQRMRGYIARVQEDDVVREDLVRVGDPDGEHQLVPKRKPTTFGAPIPYFVDGKSGGIGSEAGYGETARRYTHPRPRHWVTY